MNAQEAKALTTYLVAAFRPRDWGQVSEQIYIDGLLRFDYQPAAEVVRSLVRDVWRRMPTVAEVRGELLDALPRGPALPAERTMTAEEVEASQEIGRRILADWLEAHPPVGPRPGRIEDVVAKEPPVVETDLAEVERRRITAARAADAERARLAEEAQQQATADVQKAAS